MASRGRLIVCESSSRWAVALRRAVGSGRLRVYETRIWDDCREQLEAYPSSFVALEATGGDLARTWQRLWWLRSRWPRVRTAALGGRELEPWQWALREAGADFVVRSTREVPAMVRVATRHLAAAVGEQPTAEAAVWQRLPWGNEETT